MKKIALVTGASRGIGRATAIRLAKDFDGVALVARTVESLVEVAKTIDTLGAEPLIIAADMRNADASDTIVAQTLDKFGQINALVNIAGDVPQVDLFQMSELQWDDSFSLKFHAARKLTLSAWSELKATNGAVIFTSGSSAHTPKAAYAAVATVNAAIVTLAKAFAERGIKDQIRVNSVLPGPIMTSRRKTMLAQLALAKGTSPQEAEDIFLKSAEMHRFGKPEEVAELMAFLVSDSAPWMTGSAIRIDGGEIKSL